MENNSVSSPPKYWLRPRKVESSYLDGKVTPTLPPLNINQILRTSVPPKPVLGPKKFGSSQVTYYSRLQQKYH